MIEKKDETAESFFKAISYLSSGGEIAENETESLIKNGYLCPDYISGEKVGRCIKQLFEKNHLTGLNAAIYMAQIIKRKIDIFTIKTDWAVKMFQELPRDCLQELTQIFENILKTEVEIDKLLKNEEEISFNITIANLKVILSAIKEIVK